MRLFILPHRLSLSLGLSGCLALFGVRVLASEDDLIRQPGSELCCPGEPSVEPEDNITPLAGLTTDPPLFFEQINLEDTAETSANASVGDLDGDGDLDVVLAKGRHWPLRNRIFLNAGAGRFSVENSLFPDEQPDRTYSAALGDIDGDGDVDMVVSNDSPDGKYVYRNDGRARFERVGSWGEASWNTRNACLADMNGDRLPDLVVANRKSTSCIIINDGAGRFTREHWIAIRAESATTIVAGDFNGDSHVDLAVPHRDGGISRVFFNDGKLGFQTTVPFGPKKSSARACASGDLNRDGWTDLVIGDDKDGTMVCLNDGNGQFRNTIPVGDRPHVPYSIALGDLNNDTHPDLVVGYATGGCRLFLNHGMGTVFTELAFGDTTGAVYGLALGDLNADGRVDVVAGRSGATNAVFLNRTASSH